MVVKYISLYFETSESVSKWPGGSLIFLYTSLALSWISHTYKMIKMKSVCVCVCIDVNQGDTNRNRRTQKPVTLRAQNH